ncbi:MAG: ComEC/Rec2 family competence protein [Candidatus Nealsonbacteria bacterium]
MSLSKAFSFLCLSFVGGIFLGSSVVFSQTIILGFFVIAGVLIFIFRKEKRIIVFSLCLLLLVLGVLRYQSVLIESDKSQLHSFNKIQEKVLFSGVVENEPDIREFNKKLTLGEIKVDSQKIKGKVLITVNKYLPYGYGDRIKVEGLLSAPQEFPDFNYKEYLLKDGIYSVSYYPKIELIESGQGNFLFSKILVLKDKLRQAIYRNLSPPQSLLLAAMILGDKRQITDIWKEKLNLAGLRHLTAVSGMHVAILTAVLMSFLVGVGFWRNQAFWITLSFIFIFILITGFQASAIRAGIMGGLFLLGRYFGRKSDSQRAIIIAATSMLFVNPFLLRLDVGFQLSFLAMMGIVYLLPSFQKTFRKLPNIFQLRDIVSVTLSAQVFTLPLLMYNFGYFSLVSPLSNILIVPFLPLIMVSGFVLAVLGVAWQPLAWTFTFLVWPLLTYLAKITDWFSGFPFSAIFLEISVFYLLALYFIILMAAWFFKRRQELNFFEF